MTPSSRALSTAEPWLQLALTKGMVSEADLTAVLSEATTQHTDVTTLLLKRRLLSEAQLGSLKAEAAGLAYVELEDYQIDPAVLKLIPESLARKHGVLPLYRFENALTVAMADPWTALAIDALRAATTLPIIHPVVSAASTIRKAIERYYGRQIVNEASQPAARVGAPSPVPSRSERTPALASSEASSDVSIIKLVDALLGEALETRASDIHLEPDGEQIRVRFRIDGVLHEVKLFPMGMHEALLSRVKILAKLDITEHRLPQDGHILLTVEGRTVDLRVSTYPTVGGENLVIRVLDQSAVALQLVDLGLTPELLAQFQQLLQHSHGMLLVTGPTGSGKTTTLYAALAHINSMAKNIMTIEDPVEYQIPLIRQTQINPKAGVTFATGLRSLLRQDPDVIMVGEIRDQDTAEIAMHAALTGHLVLSTLHTNDAPGAMARLVDMGLEPYLLASTVLGVFAQRLVRRVCPHCQEGSRPSAAVKTRYPKLTVVYRGQGCRKCRHTGFLGRLGVFELFIVDESLRAKIGAKGSSHELRALAIHAGMRTMRADGLLKVQQGLTTLEELDRVIPQDAAA